MQNLAQVGFTRQNIIDALHAGNRHVSFRYELLDSNNLYKADITNKILSASVGHQALSQTKRTASFDIIDDETIDFLSDRIKPYVRLVMRGVSSTVSQVYQGNQSWPVLLATGTVYVEWPLGVFLLSTPLRKAGKGGVIERKVAAYDQTQVLVDDIIASRYTIETGTNYITAIKALLDSAGVTNQNLAPIANTLPLTRDWEPGKTKLAIINDLLEAINYLAIYFDENGVAIAQSYTSPTIRASEYTYATDLKSVVMPEAIDHFDLVDVPNKWVLTVSNPEQTPLTSTTTNENVDSPTSYQSRGNRWITRFEQVEAATQEVLDAKAERMKQEASQIYRKFEWESLIMPMHSHFDVYTLEIDELGFSEKVSETSWSMELKADALMKHSCRKIVEV